MKRTFEMNGKQYNTLTAIAKELGVKRVYVRDFAKFGITETTGTVVTDNVISKSVNILTDDDTQDEDATQEEVQDEPIPANPLNTGGSQFIFAHVTTGGIAVDKIIDIPTESTPANNVQDNATQEDQVTQDETDAPVEEDPVVTTPQTEEEKIAQIERDIVDYQDETELGQHLRKISLQGLVTMVKNIQGDLWERITNTNIRKMRLIMELKKGYFPDSQPKSKSTSGPSPWKKITTTNLKAAAAAKSLAYKDCDNEGILRMRLIMVLKAAGVTANELNS